MFIWDVFLNGDLIEIPQKHLMMAGQLLDDEFSRLEIFRLSVLAVECYYQIFLFIEILTNKVCSIKKDFYLYLCI